MIYGMVKQSGGDIFVESEEGRGTTFRLYFPRVAPPVTTEPEPSAKDEYSIAGVATVLLVEDEDDLRLLLLDFLHECGYWVLTAESGEAALRLAKSHEGEIDVLLSDIILTDTNGYDLAKELEPVAPGVKLIYMSGYTAGVIDNLDSNHVLLRKPFQMSDLVEQMTAMIGAGSLDSDSASS